MRPSSQQLIDTMIHDDREALKADAAALLKELEPALVSSASASPEAAKANQKERGLFERTSRIEQLTLYLLFGTETTEREQGPPELAARDLLAELRRLCADLETQP
jgi:hypothetical protein